MIVLVRLDNKDAHGWNRFWDDILTVKSKAVFLADACEDLVFLGAPSLFVIGIKPDLSIWIGWM